MRHHSRRPQVSDSRFRPAIGVVKGERCALCRLSDAGASAEIAAHCIGRVLQNIAWLAVQHHADTLERVEANTADLAGLQQRYVGFRELNTCGKLAGAHLALGQHDIQVDDDWHGVTRIHGFRSTGGRLHA